MKRFKRGSSRPWPRDVVEYDEEEQEAEPRKACGRSEPNQWLAVADFHKKQQDQPSHGESNDERNEPVPLPKRDEGERGSKREKKQEADEHANGAT